MKKTVAIVVLMLTALTAESQVPRPKNLAGDFSGKKRRFHFGFTLGYNKASFHYNLKPDFTFQDSLLSLTVEPAPGFNLGIISSLHIDNNWKLRFIPSLSFQDRNMIYRIIDKGEVTKIEHRVESTFLDFPLLFKWRTNRINNWCVYVIGGGQYSIDMATRSNVQSAADIVRIKRSDWVGNIGMGMDFFLPYFKFGLELKLNAGLPNVFIQEENSLSAPIARLNTRVWLLSLTFEG